MALFFAPLTNHLQTKYISSVRGVLFAYGRWYNNTLRQYKGWAKEASRHTLCDTIEKLLLIKYIFMYHQVALSCRSNQKYTIKIIHEKK